MVDPPLQFDTAPAVTTKPHRGRPGVLMALVRLLADGPRPSDWLAARLAMESRHVRIVLRSSTYFMRSHSRGGWRLTDAGDERFERMETEESTNG